jgi:hypothetical protein
MQDFLARARVFIARALVRASPQRAAGAFARSADARKKTVE